MRQAGYSSRAGRILVRVVVFVVVVALHVVVGGMSRESRAYDSIISARSLRSIPRVYEVRGTYQCHCRQVAIAKMYKYSIHYCILSGISLGTTERRGQWRWRRVWLSLIIIIIIMVVLLCASSRAVGRRDQKILFNLFVCLFVCENTFRPVNRAPLNFHKRPCLILSAYGVM